MTKSLAFSVYLCIVAMFLLLYVPNLTGYQLALAELGLGLLAWWAMYRKYPNANELDSLRLEALAALVGFLLSSGFALAGVLHPVVGFICFFIWAWAMAGVFCAQFKPLRSYG